ncbi:MAG TPA: hypothetical protein VGQ38_10070 [Gaiellaceae bacterium]|jgi:hypothetical protein|nr:hypothetical protein [Gaiellaceae bacterium]
MTVRVTIETASKAEAELIAEALPVSARAESWRGFGVIRVGARNKEETNELIEAVSRSFHEHSLKWTRVRYDDEERVFKANGNGRRVA